MPRFSYFISANAAFKPLNTNSVGAKPPGGGPISISNLMNSEVRSNLQVQWVKLSVGHWRTAADPRLSSLWPTHRHLRVSCSVTERYLWSYRPLTSPFSFCALYCLPLVHTRHSPEFLRGQGSPQKQGKGGGLDLGADLKAHRPPGVEHDGIPDDSAYCQLLGTADAQTAHHATSSTAPAPQRLGSANAETTPAGAPAAAAVRTQRPDATSEGENG